MSPIALSSLVRRMKVSSPNCYNFKKPSVQAQTIRSLHNSAYLKNVFLAILTAVWSISVSYTMVHTLCFEEVYLDIRNQSGCLRVMSFLKAGLYCMSPCSRLYLMYLVFPSFTSNLISCAPVSTRSSKVVPFPDCQRKVRCHQISEVSVGFNVCRIFAAP